MQHNRIAGDYICTQFLINHIIMGHLQKRVDSIAQ